MAFDYIPAIELNVSTFGTTITWAEQLVIERKRAIYPASADTGTGDDVTIGRRYAVSPASLCEESLVLYKEIEELLKGVYVYVHRTPTGGLGVQRWINGVLGQNTFLSPDGKVTVTWTTKAMTAEQLDEVHDFVSAIVSEYDMEADSAMIRSVVGGAISRAEQIVEIEKDR